jgi:uncharacterized protein (TIGR03086 family)
MGAETGRVEMSEQAERYRTVADGFTRRVEGVPEGRWDDPAPCEGWVARDVVRHVVEWMPGFFQGALVVDASAPSPDDDPVGAWRALDAAFRAGLVDPDLVGREIETAAGTHAFEVAVDTFCTGDLLVHTWDLARATGQDEALDATEVHRNLEGMLSFDEDLLRNSGHYGPRVEVPADADEQTRLIAYTGRQP